MNFDSDKGGKRLGKLAGYLFGYFLLTTILYFILKFSQRLPVNWGYFHIMGITIVISLGGIGLKRLLK